MKNRGIYKIVNTTNQHFYVGSAVNLQRRKARHFRELRTRRHNNRHLQNAWDKHGEAAFVFEVVEYVEDPNGLFEAEDRWLREHVGKDYCYNIGVAAQAPMLGKSGELSPTWGYKHTDEARWKISEAGRGRSHAEESKQKIRDSLRGHSTSDETKKKLSEAAKGERNFWYGKARPEFAEMVRKPIYCPTNGVTYPSIKQLREELGLKPTTVNRALKSGKPIAKGKYAGWSFQYAEKEDAPR